MECNVICNIICNMNVISYTELDWKLVNSNINLLVVLLICQRLFIDTVLITSLYMGFFYPFYLVSIYATIHHIIVWTYASLWDWI